MRGGQIKGKDPKKKKRQTDKGRNFAFQDLRLRQKQLVWCCPHCYYYLSKTHCNSQQNH